MGDKPQATTVVILDVPELIEMHLELVLILVV